MGYTRQVQGISRGNSSVPADRRASLFKYFLALKPYLGWADEREVAYDASIAYDPEEHTRHFQRFCEGVMMVLCKTGFPVDAELATQTLDWLRLTHYPRGYDLNKRRLARDYAERRRSGQPSKGDNAQDRRGAR